MSTISPLTAVALVTVAAIETVPPAMTVDGLTVDARPKLGTGVAVGGDVAAAGLGVAVGAAVGAGVAVGAAVGGDVGLGVAVGVGATTENVGPFTNVYWVVQAGENTP